MSPCVSYGTPGAQVRRGERRGAGIRGAGKQRNRQETSRAMPSRVWPTTRGNPVGQDEHAHDEDCRLMLAAAAGDRHAFEQIYAKYYPIVCDFIASRNGTCTPVADLAQEVFTRVWAGRPRYEGRSDVRTFLFGVATNVVLEAGRGDHRPDPTGQGEAPTGPGGRDPAHTAAQHEQLEALRAAVAALPQKQRRALELTHIEGVPPATAARAARISRILPDC